jgi:lipopolysaccharide biosynthesis glycosyltransferase
MSYSIVLCFDPNYQIQAWILMKSIITNGLKDEKINFYLIIENEDKINKSEFNELKTEDIKIHYLRLDTINISFIDKIYSSLKNNKKKYISRIALSKLLIPVLLTHCNKILYLDTDMLVVDSIKDLWSIKSDKPVAVVPDLKLSMSKRNARINFTENDKYFNSGLILFNIEKLKRSYNIMHIQAIYEDKNIRCRFIDQDQLNIYFKNNAHFIDISYNFFARFPFPSNERSIDIYDLFYNNEAQIQLGHHISIHAIKKVIAHPKIIHFVTQRKPWNAIDGFYYNEWKRIFMESNWLIEILCSNHKLEREINKLKDSFYYKLSQVNLSDKILMIYKKIVEKIFAKKS